MEDKILKQKIVLKRVIETENKGLKTFIDEGYGIGTVEYIKDEVNDKKENKYSLIDDIFIPTEINNKEWKSPGIFYDDSKNSGNVHLIPDDVDLATIISECNKVFRIKLHGENDKYSLQDNKEFILNKKNGFKILDNSKYFNSDAVKVNQLFCMSQFVMGNIKYQLTPYRFSKDDENFVNCKYHSIQFIRYVEGKSINFYPNSLKDECETFYEYGNFNPSIHYYNPMVEFYKNGKFNIEDILVSFVKFINNCEGKEVVKLKDE